MARALRQRLRPDWSGSPSETTLGLDIRAAATVEFAIVALPFFALLFATFQTAILFFEQQIFQTAISDASRLILTGQAQTNGLSQTQFKQAVCNKLPGFMPCSGITIDVRPYADFSSAAPFKPVDANGNLDSTKASYSIGSRRTVIVVTGYAVQPILFPMMSSVMSSAGTGKALLSASAAFRNEPWKQ